LPISARVILEVSAALIALGGLYDLFVPRLPLNLALICGGNLPAARLTRELLRALGGALLAVGITVFILVETAGPTVRPLTLILVLVLVLPAEGVNVFAMRRIGSPFYVPLSFILLALLGVILAWPNLHIYSLYPRP
jgi:hypothetical protein